MSATSPCNRGAGPADPSLPTVLLVAQPGQAVVELSRRLREQGAEVRLQSASAGQHAGAGIEPDLVVVLGRVTGTDALVRRLLSEWTNVPIAVVAAGREERRVLGKLLVGDVLFTPPGDTFERTAARLVDLAAELRCRMLLERSVAEHPPPCLPPPPPGFPDRSSVRRAPSMASLPAGSAAAPQRSLRNSGP